jgi:hypothetical protein
VSTLPLKSQAAKEEHTVGEYPGGNASAMWKTGALKAVATARSSTAARTAGLREVTNKKHGYRLGLQEIRPIPTPVELIPTDISHASR